MKKEFTSKFEIKLEFKKETENPSRIFRSFAEMIESINNLDLFIAECVNSKVKTNLILNDIEKGSIIGKFYDAIIISEDGQIDNSPNVNQIDNFIEKSRAETLDFITKNKSSIQDLEQLKETISNIAKENKIKDTFNYAEPDLLKLAKTINEINNSTDNLNNDESFSLKSTNTKVNKIKQGTPKINIETVEDALTEKEITNEFKQYYLIRKPDFLGDSAWSFKHGSKNLTIKILDLEWLDLFKSGKVVVVPGDSLHVSVIQTSKYNRNGYLISEKIEINKVNSIIHNNQQ